MNADPLTYAPFLLLLLLGALVEIRYWIRNRARMTPKARLRRGLFLAAVPVLCAALWLGWERAAFWLEEHSAPPYPDQSRIGPEDNQDGLRTFTERLWETVRSGTHAEAQAGSMMRSSSSACASRPPARGKRTVDEPLSTRRQDRQVTALFRTALANGHFVLSDILDRYAEAKRSIRAAFKVAGRFFPAVSFGTFLS
ncbi:MAG: hypothetical protein ACLR0N_09280 [Bilophila wadsworthia]